jgi:hypothetical protein
MYITQNLSLCAFCVNMKFPGFRSLKKMIKYCAKCCEFIYLMKPAIPFWER